MTTQHGRALAAILNGVEARLVLIEARVGDAAAGHLGRQPVSSETQSVLRSAARRSELQWPERIAFDIAHGTATNGCALALACAALAADGLVQTERLADTVIIGGLARNGQVLSVPEVLAVVVAAKQAPRVRRVIVPSAGLPAGLVLPGIEILRASCLADVIGWLDGDDSRLSAPAPAPVQPEDAEMRLPDVGQQREAADVAAAGGHDMVVMGSREASLAIAQRVAALRPPLSPEQRVEVAAIHSVIPRHGKRSLLDSRPPLIAPPAPNDVRLTTFSAAHHGVLLLSNDGDNPFATKSAETALTHREIVVPTSTGKARFPAGLQLVFAVPPSPWRGGSDKEPAPMATRLYLQRMAGPLMERVALHLRLTSAPESRPDTPESAAEARARVRDAHGRAIARWGTTNAAVLDEVLTLPEFRVSRAALAALERDRAIRVITQEEMLLVMRVAWTLADLAGRERPGVPEFEGARALRGLTRSS